MRKSAADRFITAEHGRESARAIVLMSGRAVTGGCDFGVSFELAMQARWGRASAAGGRCVAATNTTQPSSASDR